ncbi:MAG: polysaccharide export protein [Oscillospiraceae bacterium]|nr:polysaccharide export protein [Oscillospiraceae bacterium]
MNETTNKTEVEQSPFSDGIDLIEMGMVLLHHWWMLVVGLLVGGLLAGCYTVFAITPLYRASSTIYIFNKTTSITSLTDIQLGSQLTVDFQIIAKSREVLQAVIDDCDLKMGTGALSGSITVSNPADSHMLTITVTNPNPELAARIANSMADILRQQVADIMNTDKPSTVERAVVPTSPSSPSLTRNIEIGALIGLALVAAFLVVRFLMDDTISTEEDVRKYLGLNTLASIPYDKALKI